MKFLLLHPEDDPERGPWARRAWDRVVDLGIAGRESYDRWSEFLHGPVAALPNLQANDFARIRQTLFAGNGYVVDQHGIDWWELISIEFHQQLELVAKLQKLAQEIGRTDEVFVTRPCFQAEVLRLLIGHPATVLSRENAVTRLLMRCARIARFSPSQTLQIFGDKYDSTYNLRRFTTPRREACVRPVVLLPSAYANVSRTGLRYAQALPECDFVLVTTRQSGWVKDRPPNVKVARLASYAPGSSSVLEFESLLRRWSHLKQGLGKADALGILLRMGALDSFPKFLREGLAIRDAWLKVFAVEPVSAVLSADEVNPPTHIPLLIAAARGLPTIACHHGALDGRYRFRRSHADVVLAKGRMERDHLVRSCGVPEENVEIGAPGIEWSHNRERGDGPIVFFSEPYEVGGGRMTEFYREILPPLAKVAIETGRELVIKLHPIENLRERRQLVKAVLSSSAGTRIRVVTGPLSNELLSSTWCAITVLSTTAVDCTLRGIPVFLCQWLDYSNYGYLQQFAKFGAGRSLASPSEIANIPQMVESFVPPDTRDLHRSITSERLQQLLSGKLELASAI